MRTHLTALAAAAAAALALAACGTSQAGGTGTGTAGTPADGAQSTAQSLQADQGTVLDQPFDKPELVLTDTEGEPYDLVAETAGHATLVYFGYTHCPDICPLTMSNIAVGAAGLTERRREDLRVVFITTDPERDTPASLGSWLRAQDPDFTGLTGDFDTIRRAARSLGVHIEAPYRDDNGDIVSTHGAQVVAFLPGDDKGHVVYTEGVTAETFERDLPKLIAGETP